MVEETQTMTDMSVTQILFRDADKSDARDIAALYRLAAGGVADVIWDDLREQDDDVVDAGARRYAREDEDFSFQNCALAEARGQTVGLLHAFPMHADPEFDAEQMNPVLRPYAELEEDASYYIAGVALKPDFRGRGIGTKMLRLAELRAMTRGLAKMSLLAFEENDASVRLYERLGYRVTDSRDIVAHPFIQYDGRALLMVKQLA
jgi:ribosomal protein S18 acetylase RimI-like enzyme